MSATISLSIDNRTATPTVTKIGRRLGQWIGPKVALWIGFAVLSSTWYALDPEAHGNGYQALSQATPVQEIERGATAENPARIIMTAMQ